MATTVTPVTNLDFDAIKASIITFIKTDPTFSDYNFEGSALNAIADMLAYNTHTNAYYGNMVHNESFLDTAQKRGSVVSKAKELGYTPHSVIGSTAYVNLSVYDTVSPVLHLTRGTTFSSSNDNGTYTFVVTEDTASTTFSTGKLFSSVKLVAGIQVQNSFTVNTASNIRTMFNIPNQNVDITTLKLYVKDSVSAVDRKEYLLARDATDVAMDSAVYYVQESYDGSMTIYFGSDVIGAQPVNGNVIDIDYILADDLDLPNGCKTFTMNGSFGSSSMLIETTQVAFGGADRESIESIKYNSINSTVARKRAVTVSDYEHILKENFPFIKSVSVWGGEDAVPPQYGKIFLSVQPTDSYTISDAVKSDKLIPLLKKYSVLTVTPVFIDPDYTLVDFETFLKFNPNTTTLSRFEVESLIKTQIATYIDSQVSTFGGDYLESPLLQKLAVLDTGISALYIEKKVGFQMTPVVNILTRFVKNLNNEILPGSIRSSNFNTYNSGVVTVFIKEIPNSITTIITSLGVTQYKAQLGLYSSDTILVSEIGTVNLTTGEFDFTYLLDSYITDSRFIKLMCEFVSDDIVVLRNQILSMGIDTSDVLSNIVSNNIVTTTVYVK